MQSAVKPLVVLAKQHFRPEAEPMRGVRWDELSVVMRWLEGMVCGPESGMEGRFQESMEEGSIGAELSAGGFKLGGPPIIPPSMKFTNAGVSFSNKAAIFLAERGEMAFKSR